MLQIKYITISLLLIMTHFSCLQEKRYPFSILQAEKQMNTDPDSAAILLASYQDSVRQMPEYVQMYYDLLSVKIKDKRYIVHTSDSVISRVTRYYEKNKDRDKLMEAYHYMGRVYWDMNDMPRALGYYQKAVDASEGTKQYEDLARIYDQMGNLYAYQGVYNEALPMHHKGYYYYALAGDSSSLPYPIRNMARVYDKTGQKDSAIIYYQQAKNLAHKVGNKVAECYILGELGGLYTTMNIQKLAFQCLYFALNNPKDEEPYLNFLDLGYMYLQIDQLDSAYFYLNKSINNKNIYALSKTYKCLSILEKKKKNFRKSIKYNHLYSHWQDSITKITDTETIRKMISLYDYQKAENKSNLLMKNSKNKQLFIYQLIVLIAIIVGGSIIYIFITRNKQKKEILEQQQKDELREKQYKKNQAYIEENKQKIKKLENQLLWAKEKQNEKQIELIHTQKEVLEITNQKIIKQVRLVEDFKQSDIYLKFQDPLNMDVNKITEEEWDILQVELNNVYDNFTKRLYALYPQLSIIELRICCLLKISVTVTNMARLLGRSKSAITAARIRLHSKLRGEIGTADKLDFFIVNF